MNGTTEIEYFQSLIYRFYLSLESMFTLIYRYMKCLIIKYSNCLYHDIGEIKYKFDNYT